MKIVLNYINDNKLVSGVFIYMAISMLVNILFSVDIMIPCVWKTIFDIECPACGLSRSAIKLIQFDFVAAYKQNPLIFIVLPAFTYYLYTDFRKYRKKKLTSTDS